MNEEVADTLVPEYEEITQCLHQSTCFPAPILISVWLAHLRLIMDIY